MTSAALELSPKPSPSPDARRDGDDVLQSAAQLDPQQVRARIDAEGGPVKELCTCSAVAGSRLAATMAVGMSRATSMAKVGPDKRGASGLGRGLGQDAAHGQAGIVFDALGHAGDQARVIGQGGG